MTQSEISIYNIKKKLNSISDEIDETYKAIKIECKKELQNEVKQKETIKNSEMRDLYEKLIVDEASRIRWIRVKLPKNITRFHYIRSNEIRLIEDTIYIGVSIGRKSVRADCWIMIEPRDIGWR